MFPAQHLVTIPFVDQTATDVGTQDTLAYLGLHLGDGSGIQSCCCMKIHARYYIRNVCCVVNATHASWLEYPVDDATVEVGVFV